MGTSEAMTGERASATAAASPSTRRVSQDRLAACLPPAGWAVVALTVLAAALRCYHLGDRPLWLDETTTARAMRFHTLGAMLAWMHGAPDQMPIFNVVTWLLGGLGGTEWALRLPSVVAGVAGIPALYVLGRNLYRPRVGLVAALVMAVLPFAVWYGQEARSYALLMLLTTLQMLFAYRSVVYGGIREWAGLVVVTVLNLYTHYDALFVTVASFAFIGCVLVVAWADVLRASRQRHAGIAASQAQVAAQTGASVVAVALIGASYLPWLPYVRAFQQRPDLGFGQFVANNPVTLAGITALLAQFNVTGVLLALVCLGGGAALVWVGLGCWRPSALLLLWATVPLGGFWLRLHGGLVTVTPRYLSFLVPAAVLLAAVGVEAVTLTAGRLCAFPRDNARSIVTSVTSAVVALAVLSQLAPALAQQYSLPKTDYRSAANSVSAESPPGSVALAMSGACNYYIIGSLGYYFWRRHADILVVDAAQLDDRVAARLRQGRGRVWGAVITGSGNSGCDAPIDVARLPTAGLDVRPFTEITVVRPRRIGLTPMAQAEALLRWGSLFQPQLLSSVDLLDVLTGRTRLGGNLAPPLAQTGAQPAGEQWRLAPGATLTAHGRGVVLAPHNGTMIDVTLTTRRAVPGQRYVLLFAYRNGAFHGEQKVYVSATDAQGHWLDIFPNGAGYSCAPTTQWARGAFALTVPRGTTALTIWLRATGNGSAAFTDVTLQPTN